MLAYNVMIVLRGKGRSRGKTAPRASFVYFVNPPAGAAEMYRCKGAKGAELQEKIATLVTKLALKFQGEVQLNVMRGYTPHGFFSRSVASLAAG